MWTAIFAGLFAFALLKGIAYKVNTLAIIWYYEECGVEMPDKENMHKYRTKVVRKLLCVKEG